MIAFRLISTVFDMLTFAFPRMVVRADPEIFRTSWFAVSLLTEFAPLPVLQTTRRCWTSAPSRPLLWSSILVALLTLALPYSGEIARLFASRPLAPVPVCQLLLLVASYALVTVFAKRRHDIHGK